MTKLVLSPLFEKLIFSPIAMWSVVTNSYLLWFVFLEQEILVILYKEEIYSFDI